MLDLKEAIRRRHSVRAYREMAVEQEKLDILADMIDQCNRDGV